MALSDNTRGALFMVGSMTCFPVNDAFMKTLADDMSLVQAVFLRGVATTCLMLLLIRVLRISTPRLDRKNHRLFFLRNVAGVSAAPPNRRGFCVFDPVRTLVAATDRFPILPRTCDRPGRAGNPTI